jgi:hypothetical protein
MKDRITLPLKIVRLLAFLLSVVVVVYAANYLIFGGQISTVQEIPLESQEPPPPAVIESEPYPAAFIPFAATVILMFGLLTDRVIVAWAGWAALTVFSGLFLFSSGGVLLPIAGVLLILLLANTFLQQKKMQEQPV